LVASKDIIKEFEAWKAKHHKVYLTEEEHGLRLKNFVASMKRIDKLNQQNGARFALNKFSDMSEAEFRSKFLLKNPIRSNGVHPEVKPLSAVGAPASMDWRNTGVVSAVKDQKQCGSCWAFSVTESIETAWMMAKNLKNTTFKPLAPQQIVDCDTTDSGCNGGDPTNAYAYVMSAGGLDYESAYPYTALDGTCSFKKTAVGAQISSWKYATSWEDETTLKANVAQVGPVSICVDAANWQDYAGGVLGSWQCAWVNMLDHCVQLVGYDVSSSNGYWIVRNSWGPDWGEQGFIRLGYGGNTCGLTNEATYPVV
jgi:C1A family cysteine protease